MYKLVIIRHGESLWNKENIFTGWTDIGLSPLGEKQAEEAGQILKAGGFAFDLAYTSVLSRAIDTLKILLKEMSLESIETKMSWRLNERHYGDLQGKNKAEMIKLFGENRVKMWRRDYNTRPPALTKEDKRYPGFDEKYKDLKNPPLTESLKDTEKRVFPYFRDEIIPEIKKGRKIIISAHGNSIRALAKIIENITDEEISRLDIELGKPLIYELDDNLNFLRKFYLP